MCGIWAYISKHGLVNPNIYSIYSDVPRVRGPDRTVDVTNTTDSYSFVFHRLAINDLSSDGDQPFTFTDSNNYTYYIICNGEIYNYKSIIKQFNIKTKSKSDCEVLCYLFENFWNTPIILANILDGEYAIVAMRIHPNGEKCVIALRDPFGVRPLYWAQVSTDTNTHTDTYDCEVLAFSSLLGGICKIPNAVCDHFPPGHVVAVNMSRDSLERCAVPEPFYTMNLSHTLTTFESCKTQEDYYPYISSSLIHAVQKRIVSTDRELGFFLSGGLDSSLVVGIATRILGLKKPRTFSIGMIGSSDLQYAKEVATFLDTDHTEVYFTSGEAVAAIPEVIACLETYDITTIRASTPSYLLAKYIKNNTQIRVIMNGDGSDEVSCGYLYNYNAPDPEAGHEDALRLLNEIHKFDGLRCDRTIAGNGIEARVPFLDPEFVEAYLSIPASLRIPTPDRMEKLMLRNAFDSYIDPVTKTPVEIMPKSVLFRRKEAFSNGVSCPTDQKTNMISCIQDWAATHNTTEPLMYKCIFNQLFPNHTHVLPHYWMPKWSGETNDPSATTLNIYKKLNT